jgi:membrane-bound ClpP family serine protease
VHGLAASAASVIAMAGDKVIMGDGAFLMIHNAWTVGIGDTREMAKMGRTLARIDKELAGLYAEKTGIDTADIRDMMNEETWLAASDAIEQGFADETFSDPKSAAKAAALYDMSAFKNVPKALIATKRRGASAKSTATSELPTPPVDTFSPQIKARLEGLMKSFIE